MTRFQRWFLYGSTIATAVSGITYFVMKHFLEPSDPWAVINHPLEPWALKAHILSAPIMLFAVGLITSQHIWRSLKSSLPTGRHSGRIAAYVFGPLVLSGYLIQSLTSPLTARGACVGASRARDRRRAGAIGVHRGTLHGRRKRRTGALPVLQLPNQLDSTESEEIARYSSTGPRGAGSYVPNYDDTYSPTTGAHVAVAKAHELGTRSTGARTPSTLERMKDSP